MVKPSICIRLDMLCPCTEGVSATLRAQSEEVQAFGAMKTHAAEDRVTEALKSRLGKLGQVKNLLESEVLRTDVQITKMSLNKERTEHQLAKQRIALELNQRRLVLRETRPAREMVHDEVQVRPSLLAHIVPLLSPCLRLCLILVHVSMFT